MKYNDVVCNKTLCERYTLRFNDGRDRMIFTIDSTGVFNAQGSLGNYAYQWSSFGDDFKKFLCELDSGYLFNKLCNGNYFDVYEFIKNSKREIVSLRKDYELTKEEARELWEFFEHKLDDSGSYDLISTQLFYNDILSEKYCNEVFYSPFWPEKGYSPDEIAFVEQIYPLFVDILKKELMQSSAEL